MKRRKLANDGRYPMAAAINQVTENTVVMMTRTGNGALTPKDVKNEDRSG
jgi:hypothetical protein